MRQKNIAKKRKLKGSDETRSSGPVNVSTTSQHVDPNVSNTTGLAATVVAEMRQHPRRDAGGQIAGYIFMCNTRTKPDCYTYRVFGLPASMIGVVERIKPNTKLFLYDFEVKLLYGLYVADSIGKLALEPYAFGGRFPAQVKFSIAKDCLPLPVAAFKDAIDCTGSKFKQDLSYEQVNRLVSLFRPFTLPSPHQASLSFHSAAKGPHHDVLRHPSYRHVQEAPLPGLHSSHSHLTLERGGELASDPYHSYVTYKRYAPARTHQEYYPDDPYVQQHDTRVGYGRIPKIGLSTVVPPPAPSATSYYGQNKRPPPTISPSQLQAVTPSSAIQSSSLTAAQWVAMAANTQNSGDTISTLQQSSSGPGASHVTIYHDGSGYTDTGYGYPHRGYPGTHEAVSVPSEQPVLGYSQSHGNPALPHTSQPGSSGVDVVDAYSAGVSYGHGNQPYGNYHQTPHVSVYQNVNNAHAPETPSTGVSYGHGNQPYGNYHQTPHVSIHQNVNNAHAPETPSAYAPAYYMNQEYPNSQVTIPEGSAGYGYENQAYSGYYQAPSVTGDQGVTNDLPVHAYENLPASNSGGYVHSQGVPALPQTLPSVVENAYSYYHQGYYSSHQMTPITSHQEVNVAPAQLSGAHPI